MIEERGGNGGKEGPFSSTFSRVPSPPVLTDRVRRPPNGLWRRRGVFRAAAGGRGGPVRRQGSETTDRLEALSCGLRRRALWASCSECELQSVTSSGGLLVSVDDRLARTPPTRPDPRPRVFCPEACGGWPARGRRGVGSGPGRRTVRVDGTPRVEDSRTRVH